MNKTTPSTIRKLRTRTLIQLGGLIEKAGVLDALDISLGDDLQKDTNVKEAMITLFGALIDMKETVLIDPDQKHLCLLQGKQAFLDKASVEQASLNHARVAHSVRTRLEQSRL